MPPLLEPLELPLLEPLLVLDPTPLLEPVPLLDPMPLLDPVTSPLEPASDARGAS